MSGNNKSIFIAAAAYIMWGLLPIYWKAVQNFDSAFVLGIRVITTFIFTLIIIIYKKANLYRGVKPLITIIIAGIFLGLNWYLYIYTVNSGHVLEAGLAYYIAPILSILIGIIFFREKKTPLEYAAIVLMFIGMIYQTITLGKPPIMAFFIGLTFSVYGLFKKMTIYSGWESLFLETSAILIWEDGTEKQIDTDVSNTQYKYNGKMAYMKQYDFTTGIGDLYYYDGENTTQLDSGVTAIYAF